MNALTQAISAYQAYSSAWQALADNGSTASELSTLYAAMQAWQARIVELGGSI